MEIINKVTGRNTNKSSSVAKIDYNNRKIVPSGYMSLLRHGLLVRLKYVEVVSVFTA